MPHRILAILIPCLLFAVPGWASLGPKEVDITCPEGTVHFSHMAHQEREPNCRACHHRGIKRGRCRYCHGVWIQAPAPKKAFHTLCISCHKKSSGPIACEGCHQP